MLAAISLASGQSSNKSLPELDEGIGTSPSESQEVKPRAALRDKNSKASSISLEDNDTTSGSVGRIEQYGSEACAGSTGREACTGSVKMNKVVKCSSGQYITSHYNPRD
jgi:hypothetical protein